MSSSIVFVDANLSHQPEVLLVDDDEVNLLLTALALRERGFTLVEASSGEQALAILRGWTEQSQAAYQRAAALARAGR